MVIHDLDDFGYPHDLGNLEMALTSIGDPFFRAVDSYRIESSETLWQNTVDNQSQWWRLEHILEVRSVQSCCFSFWWTWTFQGWSTCIEVCDVGIHPSINASIRPSIHPLISMRIWFQALLFATTNSRPYGTSELCIQAVSCTHWPIRTWSSGLSVLHRKVSHWCKWHKWHQKNNWAVVNFGGSRPGWSWENDIYSKLIPGFQLFTIWACYIPLIISYPFHKSNISH